MTETLRFGLIGKQDLKTGTGTFEVRLGDGRVVTLDEIRLTDFLSALTTGSVLFVKTGGVAGEDNTNLFWDDTNNRLGIGTATPTVQLDATGAAKIGSTLSVVGIILSDANLTFKSGTSFTGTLDHVITADRTWTLQDSSDTILGRATTDTLTGKTLLATGTGNVVAGILDRDVTTNDVVNTVTETTVYTFSVPANTLSTNRALRLTLIGDYLNDTLGSATLTVRVKYGGTNILFLSALSLEQAVTRRGLQIAVTLSAQNSTNAQVSAGTILVGLSGTTAGTVQGDPSRNGFAIHNAVAIDSTLAQTMAVTFQHGTADANISARALAVQLEVLQ